VSARPLARGAPATDEQLRRSCPSLSSLPILVSCGQPGGGAQRGASGEGRGRPNLQWRQGGGDGAGPHVGAVVLPVEQRRGRTMRWSVAPYAFFRVEISEVNLF
jgi:hypothetical protein